MPDISNAKEDPADIAQPFPYEFDPETRRKAKVISERRVRIGLGSSLAGVAALLFLLLSGISERYAVLLSVFQWNVASLIFISTITSAFYLITFPFRYAGYRMAKRAGTSKQSIWRWLADRGREYALSIVFSCIGAELILLLIVSTPYWWIAAAGAVMAATVVYSILFPLLLTRFFIKLQPLEESALKAQIESMAQKAGVRRLHVYVMRESGRSTGANAFVTGIGRSKRMVLFDNLLKKFNEREVETIVAHEIGHCVNGDTARSLLLQGILLIAGALVMRTMLSFVLHYHLVYGLMDANLLLWLALAMLLFELALTPATNYYSRARETRADLFSLQMVKDPVAFISSEKRLCDINLMEEDVPRWRKIFFATHPTTTERIRLGENWAKGTK
ncbi:MAG: M48 family metalloprotease [Methanomassiliicoccales archaeon]